MAQKIAHKLAQFFDNSQYHMADITYKSPTRRRAVAMGRIEVGATAYKHIVEATLPKGDVLKIAEVAGVQAAKQAWQQIPLCHPLLLDYVAVYLDLEADKHAVAAYATVATTAKTGVEMEALAAVNGALLTLYDLTKPVEPSLNITDVRLLLKQGGKKGLWLHPTGIPDPLQQLLSTESKSPLENRTAAVITLSDRAHKGDYQDRSGTALKQGLEDLGCQIIDYSVLPDEAQQLEEKLIELTEHQVELIITTGGTGIAPRDITPQTVAKLAAIDVPGIGELLRSSCADHVPTTWLSRSYAAVIQQTLVIALPGSTGAIKDGLSVISSILPHALDHVQDVIPKHGHQHK